MKLIPVLNSDAGASLTLAQWQQTGITHFAFEVLNLLKRPGLTSFQLKSPGISIVDCRLLTFNDKKQIRYRGIDGSFNQIELESFLEWLTSIGADAVVWPFTDIKISCTLWHLDVVSDKPARDAMAGRFYANGFSANILDQRFEKDLGMLDRDCECETCSQKFTRAYLYHLFAHTPLLAQRYLVAHNVYQCQLHGIHAE